MVQHLNNGSGGFAAWNAARDKSQKNPAGNLLVWGLIAIVAGWLIGGWLSPTETGNRKLETGNNESSVQYPVSDIQDLPMQILAGERLTARVSGLRLSEIELLNFADEGGNIALLPHAFGEFAEVGFVGTGTQFPTNETIWTDSGFGGGTFNVNWTSPTGVRFNRQIILNTETYVISISDTITNNSNVPVSLAQYARFVRAEGEPSQFGMVAVGGIAYADGRIERQNWRRMARRAHMFSGDDGFVGFTDQYWQTVARIITGTESDKTMRMRVRPDGMFQADIAADAQNIMPGGVAYFSARIFAGPKNQSDLRTAAQLIPGIERTIDYGFFGFLTRPMLWSLNAIHAIVMNYGLAIIIFTILLRIVMWPLTKKAIVGMQALQKMQPEMARIQKKHGHDKMRMQQEMMNLYKNSGANPMGGCLPMLLQIPIFFALYKALLISVPMRHAEFLWITDLSTPDAWFILPVIMGATMWYQMRLQNSVKPTDERTAQMQKIMKMLPIVFTFMFAFMPAGLVLYWTVSNVFGIGQMIYIKRKSEIVK